MHPNSTCDANPNGAAACARVRVPRRRREEGGLLIILMVGVAIMSIGVGVAAQAWSVTWRRDSEEELIFRANQYVDALVLYRKDHGNQFPTDLQDLMKLGPRQVRYIRKLFKDPVNPGGQWGLLYLMPSGTAIYDPVAAQRAQSSPPKDDSVDGSGDGAGGGTGMSVSGPNMGGVTPIGNLDPNGTGVPMPGGIGGLMAQPGGPAARGALGMNNRFGGQQGAAVPGGMLPGAVGAYTPGATGGFPAGGAGGFPAGGAGNYGALPPPKPKSGSFDEDSPSEPPIGWPIVGVISRATGDINDKTYKIYKGHDKVNEWQFHVFDRTTDVAQMPQGPLPGGSAPAFLGPGFGGKGPISGFGTGAGGWRQGGYGNQQGGQGWSPGSNRNKVGGMGQRQGGGQQGGGPQGGGQWPNNGGD